MTNAHFCIDQQIQVTEGRRMKEKGKNNNKKREDKGQGGGGTGETTSTRDKMLLAGVPLIVLLLLIYTTTWLHTHTAFSADTREENGALKLEFVDIFKTSKTETKMLWPEMSLEVKFLIVVICVIIMVISCLVVVCFIVPEAWQRKLRRTFGIF